MDPIEVRTRSEAEAVWRQLTAFLDEDNPDGALTLVNNLAGDDVLVTQARALALTEGGRQKKDRRLLLEGLAGWESLLEKGVPVEYNAANAEQGLWDIAVSSHGHVEAMETEHKRLERARLLYRGVVANKALSEETRLQASVNLGNSYDSMGRELDAMEVWEEAIQIDPEFAMARGNIGKALLAVAPFVGEHSPTVLREAARNLDLALAKPDDLVRLGGAEALKHFQKERARIKGGGSDQPRDTAVAWPAGYFGWCRKHELFLHASHRCLRVDTKLVDPLFFAKLNADSIDEGERRINDLVDAFNAIKQAYASARYAAWLAVSPGDSQKEELNEARRRMAFLDTLSYARFGVRTGLAIQAFSAATNVLDQVASFVHLYLRTGRDARGVYFRYLWHKRDHRVMEPEFATRLQPKGHCNRGLLALCDLASDLDQDTLLAELVDMRHAATHRFLVLHDFLLESSDGPWVDRLDWSTFCDQMIAQLRIARAAIVYLARTVDIEDDHARRGDRATQHEGLVLELPLFQTSDDLAELD